MDESLSFQAERRKVGLTSSVLCNLRTGMVVGGGCHAAKQLTTWRLRSACGKQTCVVGV